MEEIVDIVDEQGKVLYQTSKSDAHAKGLLHKTVIANLRDKDNNFVLVVHAAHKQDPGTINNSVGGHICAGETDEEGLAREVKEEIGITTFTSKKLGQQIFNREVLGKKENHLFIIYEIYSDETAVVGDEGVNTVTKSTAQLKEELKNTPEKYSETFHFVVKNFYPQLLQ